MNKHQVSVAAESFAATLLAQSSYNVSVQYGANQPDYDLIAEGKAGIAKVSVKGSSDGGWSLAINYKKGNTYYGAIDKWLSKQKREMIFIFVQFLGVEIGEMPRTYASTPREIATHMKTQHGGKGHMALLEDYQRDHPKSQYADKVPAAWIFSKARIDALIRQQTLI